MNLVRGSRHNTVGVQLPQVRALQTALQLVILSAKKYNKVVLDGVYLNVKDLEGFEKECIEVNCICKQNYVQGKEFGFDGKTLIHPSTVDITNRVFAPSATEVEDARNIIACFQEAERSGK